MGGIAGAKALGRKARSSRTSERVVCLGRAEPEEGRR